MKDVVKRINFKLMPSIGAVLKKSAADHYLFVKDKKKRRKMATIAERWGDIAYYEKEWGIETEYGNIFLRHDGSDVDVYWQVLINGEYKTVVDSAIMNGITIRNIVDAGSNIGLTTLFFLHHFPGARVVALEPDDDNYTQAVKNTASQSGKLVLLKQALWSDDADVYLHDDFRDARDWARNVSVEETSKTVRGISLNSLMKEHDVEVIDILKMDIEGGEAAVFKPGADISFLNNTKIVAMEIHDEFDCRTQIHEILWQHKFVMYTARELTVAINTKFLK